MGHGKETPRQKMIGMMYLVLMALLALNVSKEVLDAFAVLDNGLISTKETIELTNDRVMNNFKEQFVQNSAKVGPWLDIAQKVNEEAEKIVEFIQEKKIEIIKKADGENAEAIEGHHVHGDLIKGKDITSVPAFIMVGDNNDKAGKVLSGMIDEYRNFINSKILTEGASEDTRNSINSSLNTDKGVDHKSGEKVSWESSKFEHIPIAGVIAIMTGLQINVRNAESEALRFLYTNIDKGAFKFNNLNATSEPATDLFL